MINEVNTVSETASSPCTINRCARPLNLPHIVTIREASALMNLPPYYLRRLCKEVPGVAKQSGNKWYINLDKLADYYNNQLN